MAKFNPMGFKFSNPITTSGPSSLLKIKTDSDVYSIKTNNNLATPITDPSFWKDRCALTQISLIRPDVPESEGALVLDDAVITIDQPKTIVETSLVGHSGTIKEYIGSKDYSITITVGIIATDKKKNIVDEYPIDALENIRTYLEYERELKVKSPFLDIFGISRMAIKSYSLTQNTQSNYQQITIVAASDAPFSIPGINYSVGYEGEKKDF